MVDLFVLDVRLLLSNVYVASFNGQQDEPKRKVPLETRGMGWYACPPVSGGPLYAGPNAEKAPDCEADNYLALGVDDASFAEVEGCYLNDENNPALDGPSWESDKLDVKV